MFHFVSPDECRVFLQRVKGRIVSGDASGNACDAEHTGLTEKTIHYNESGAGGGIMAAIP